MNIQHNQMLVVAIVFLMLRKQQSVTSVKHTQFCHTDADKRIWTVLKG